MTLNNYDYLPIQICREDLENTDVNLVLTGQNYIKDENVADIMAFESCSHLVISGDGSLNIENNNDHNSGRYNKLIASNGLALNSGTIWADTQISDDTTVNGGYLGGKISFPEDGSLDSNIKLTLNDGKINAMSIDYHHYESGKYPTLTMEINGGTLTSTDTIRLYNGSSDSNLVIVNRGTVNALSGFWNYSSRFVVNDGQVNLGKSGYFSGWTGGEAPLEINGGEYNVTKEFSNEAVNDFLAVNDFYYPNSGVTPESIVDRITTEVECSFEWVSGTLLITGGSLNVKPYCFDGWGVRAGTFEIHGGEVNVPSIYVDNYKQTGGDVNIVMGGLMVGAGRESTSDRDPAYFAQGGGTLTINTLNPEMFALNMDIGYVVFNGGTTNISGGSIPVYVTYPGDTGIDIEEYRQYMWDEVSQEDGIEEEDVPTMCANYESLNQDIADLISEFHTYGYDITLSKSSFNSISDCESNLLSVNNEIIDKAVEVYLQDIIDYQYGGALPPKEGALAFNDGDITISTKTVAEIEQETTDLLCPYYKYFEYQTYEECINDNTGLYAEDIVSPLSVYVVRVASSQEWVDNGRWNGDYSFLETPLSAIQIGNAMIKNPENTTVALVNMAIGSSASANSGATFSDGEGEPTIEIMEDPDDYALHFISEEHIMSKVHIYRNVEPEDNPDDQKPPVPATDDEEDSNPGAGNEGFLTTNNNNKAIGTYSFYTIIASVLIGTAVGVIVYRRLNRNN